MVKNVQWAPIRHFIKETQIANMEKFSTWLIMKKIQIKTTMKYHLTQVTVSVAKMTTNKHSGEDVEKGEVLTAAGGCRLIAVIMEDTVETPGKVKGTSTLGSR